MPERLLRLYPRAWRERYGDEFAALMQARPLTLWTFIDILSGAIDARLSSEVRASGLRGSQTEGGVVMIETLKRSCARSGVPFSTRDGFIGAALMLGGTILFSVSGIVLRRNGWPITGEVLKSLAFPGSMLLSFPATFLKGQPWRAQAAIILGLTAILVLIGYVATQL